MSNTNTPDLIPRSAVLEAIDMRCDADTLVALREYIAALPAAPVDSTPAPQPALDVVGLVARVNRFVFPGWTALPDGILREMTELISDMYIALTTLAAALKQERERAEQPSKPATGKEDDECQPNP